MAYDKLMKILHFLRPNSLRPVLFAALTLLAVPAGYAAPAAAAAAVTVGDPQHPEALAEAIQSAYTGGAKHIKIAPGTYLLPDVDHHAITLDGWKDATLSAAGATLILTDLKWDHNLFQMTHCVNVTLAGGTLSQNKITSYQGRIVSVGKNAEGKAYCDWKPDAGYPVPPADAKKFPSGLNVVDAKTRLLKIGVGDYWNPPMEKLDAPNDDLFRIQFDQPELKFGVGDWIVGRYGDAPFKVHLVSCRRCVVKDLTLMRNGFSPIREEGDGGGNRILRCRWVLGPRPGSATENPLISGAADGLHSTEANPGPDIENCVFEGVILDDCFAIHGSLQEITAVNGPVLTVKNGSAHLAVGDPARIADGHGFTGEATVTALKDNGDNTSTVTLDQDLNKDLHVPVGAKMSNPRRNGAGYKILGCRLGNTRSRGILIKGDDGLIQGNTIIGCGMAAVSLGPEYYWNEGDYVRNTRILGNTIEGCGKTGWGGGAILIHGDGAMGNQNVVIQNNRFVSNYQGEVEAEWVDGVTLTGNVIVGASRWPLVIAPQSPIMLKNCRDVTLRGNVVKNASVYKPMLVVIGDNVSGVQNNGPAGIKAATVP